MRSGVGHGLHFCNPTVSYWLKFKEPRGCSQNRRYSYRCTYLVPSTKQISTALLSAVRQMRTPVDDGYAFGKTCSNPSLLLLYHASQARCYDHDLDSTNEGGRLLFTARCARLSRHAPDVLGSRRGRVDSAARLRKTEDFRPSR